ncbi:hypothetical protein BDW59DRAFT_140226 [Aspergillus cavernicola]|uniref:3-hydroxyisobutyrate dehydrogenase protein n=1 Tax=Aspergillus cavernicola TaxID=176166 RepID=A0ABR4IUZ6_9EURO
MDVQATQTILDHAAGHEDCSPWRRIPIQGPTHTALRLAFWLMKPRYRDKSGAGVRVWAVAVRVILWLPASILVFFAMIGTGADKRDESAYDPFLYHYSGTASGSSSSQRFEHIQRGRLLRPRYLCLADEEHEYQIISVLEWERTHGPDGNLEYVFVAYTAQHFQSEEDYDELHVIAARAARSAGVPAYWIACSCMPEEDMHRALPDQVVDLAADIYRISDVVRGSHSLVIIVGSPDKATQVNTETLPREWGRRMWTFPEVVLSPSHKEITIYTRGGDLDHPVRVRKALFPRLAWNDASDSQQLIDHYEGIQTLGYLQLVSIGLKCLAARETRKKFKGDIVYALMGLLWCRPQVNDNDTAFQAFCRLSLANDSNHLLERLICLCPSRLEMKWHDIDDFWNRKLWNIDTSCRVVAVAGNDTVILSGALGCSIRWESFPRVPLTHLWQETEEASEPASFSFGCAGIFLWLGLWFLIVGVIVIKYHKPDEHNPEVIAFISAALLGVSLIACLFLPYRLHSGTEDQKATASGPRRRSQRWLVGFEGYLDLETLESTIFGFNTGHLRWSVESSSLSRSREEAGELIGLDPYAFDPDVAELIDLSTGAPFGHRRIFTLVDTYNMTATLFQAVYPPVAMLLCGSEGGMQRALLCSYDKQSGCLYRETVLRVPSTMSEKMHWVDRFRLGLERA